jgi:hypothetical protein
MQTINYDNSWTNVTNLTDMQMHECHTQFSMIVVRNLGKADVKKHEGLH